MKTYKSESVNIPQTWDKTSCPNCVYHNTNIVEVPATEEAPVMFKYDVTEYTNKEYINLMDDMLSENTDAIIELAEIIGG